MVSEHSSKKIGQDMCSPKKWLTVINFNYLGYSGIHITDFDEVETSILE